MIPALYETIQSDQAKMTMLKVCFRQLLSLFSMLARLSLVTW
jgi:hypothetical protein